eukprot:jgi/Botrbrau1/800/Bobra.0181s0053.1
MRIWKQEEEVGKVVGIKLHMLYDAGEASPILHPWWKKPDTFIVTCFVWYAMAPIGPLERIGILQKDYTKLWDAVVDFVDTL